MLRLDRACFILVVLLLVADVTPAFARKQYMDAFKAKYPKVAEMQKVSCKTCHPAKSKKVRNDFAKGFGKHLGKKNQKSPDAIRAAFDNVDKEASPYAGKTYGELFAVGGSPDGFVSIFDGTLKGWDGNPKLWSIEDGVITGKTTDEDPIAANTFLIWKEGKVANFEITFDYKLIKGNSGMQYRSFMLEKGGKWAVGGYQADFESGKTYSGILYGEQFRGILANRGLKTEVVREGDKVVAKTVGSVGKSEEIQAKIKSEDWNQYHISAKGFHFVHKINDVVTCECTDKDEKMRRKDGIIAFQLHKGPAMKLQIRNVRMKKLAD
jgi:hypothetical protein